MKFPFDGDYMFHAHVSEFAELGWSGLLPRRRPVAADRRGGRGAYCELPWGGGGEA